MTHCPNKIPLCLCIIFSFYTVLCKTAVMCQKNLLYHIWTVGNPWLTKIKGNSLRSVCLVKIKPSILLRLYSLSRHWSSKGKYFHFQATEFSRTTSPPRRAQHFATGNKPSRISLTCLAYYRLPLQCIGTDCYNRVAGSGKVSGPGCRDCGAPTPHTRTRIVRFRDHTKVGAQAKDQYFDFFIAPDFFWCSRHWELCWNWHQRHRGEVDFFYEYHHSFNWRMSNQ